MPRQLLIYDAAVPLTHDRHRDCSVETGTHYEFSAKINSIPLTAVEFPFAAAEYTVVFGGTKENAMPVALVGLRDDENLFLSKEGGWAAKYRPAFVRQYPFVFAPTKDGQKFLLCIDESFAGVNREGRGEKLFGADSKPTPYVEGILKFLQEFQVQFRRTQAFCQKLRELNLLDSMQAQLDLKSGERLSLGGFLAVDRKKLRDLASETLGALAKSGELELIYLHLQSMRNFTGLQERLETLQAHSS